MFACTVIVTVSADDARPPGSVTVRLKVSVVSLASPPGAVKTGFAIVVLLRVTVVPAVWDHA